MSTTSSSVDDELYAVKGKLDINLDCATNQVAVLDLELDVATGKTLSSTTPAFIKCWNSSAGTATPFLFYLQDAIGTKSDTAVVTTVHADHPATHQIKINVAGTTMWLLACTDVPSS